MNRAADFVATRGYPCWLRIDYDTLLSNIATHLAKAPLLDVSLPFLQKIWPHLEDDLIRNGLTGVLSSSPTFLLSASPSLQRILRPGYRPAETGYAREGLLPVLGSFADCLNLSNMAQIHDRRLPFLLRARARSGEFGAGDWGLDTICEQLTNIPMIDIAGFFLLRQPESNEVFTLRRHLRRLESPHSSLVVPLSLISSDYAEYQPFISAEVLGLESGGSSCFPIETGFWAFPVRSGHDYQLYQVDLGAMHGLPAREFPASIGGCPARQVNLQPGFCEFIVDSHLPGPFPVAGYLTGGPAHAPIDLRAWQPAELLNLIGHMQHCPVYLQTGNRLLEMLP